MEIDKKIILYIDSNERIGYPSGSDSDFSIQYDIPTGIDYDNICVLTANIPKSYYLITSGHNSFTLQENAATATITVPIGNYNINSLVNKIEALLTAGSPNGNTYTLSYPSDLTDAQTGKITFQTSGAQTTKFIFGSAYPGIVVSMGFNPSSTNTFSAQSLTSTNVININNFKSVYITCDAVSDGTSNILQEIPNQSVGTLNVLYFQTTSIEAWSKPFTQKNTNLYRFKLVDEFNNTIELNGVPWNMSILLYKKDDLGTKIKKFIKYLAVR